MHYSGNSEQILEYLCESGLIQKLKLLQLADSKLCGDPEESIELLNQYAKQLSELEILRLPLDELMEEERVRLKVSIPNLSDSTPPYPNPPSWHLPFNPDKYDYDDFQGSQIMSKKL